MKRGRVIRLTFMLPVLALYFGLSAAAHGDLPVVTNAAASAVTANSAQLNGYLVSTGGLPASVLLYWGDNDGLETDGDWDNTNSFGQSAEGALSANATGLSPNTFYYYRYYATNSSGSSWASPSASFMSDDFNDWRHKMKITLAYDKGDTLTNFPALVVFNESLTNFQYGSFASAAGGDLRFADVRETTELNYEIETWNTNGNSYVWVQVPQLTNGTIIWAYWGRDEETNPPAYTTNCATWADEFVVVNHLAQTSGVTVADSTTNRFHGTLQNPGTAAWTNTLIAGGLQLDGTNSYYELPDIRSRITNNAATLMMMMKTVEYGGGKPLWRQTGLAHLVNYGGGGAMHSHYPDYTGAWYVYGGVWRSGFFDRVDNIPPDRSVIVTNWHLVTFASETSGGGRWRMYQNASRIADVAASSLSIPAAPYIGREPTKPAFNDAGEGWVFNMYLQGTMDEVRISNVARPDNWVWACWMTMISNGVFTTYGSVQLNEWGSVLIIE